ADDPDLAVVHDAYADVTAYMEKLNRYTDEEARAMDAAGIRPTWQNMLGHFAEDWHIHYDRMQAGQDGMHGFVQSLLCALYRFVACAKVWDLRRKRGELPPDEPLPANVPEMLQFLANVIANLESAGKVTSAPVRVKTAILQTASGDHEQLLDLTRAH